MLERLFKLREHRTSVSVEIMAGVATFLTVTYILAVNPSILAKAGVPADAQFTATCLGIIFGTLLMGLYANLPFVLAPGMGMNMYFAYGIIIGKGYSIPEAFTAVFLAGILFVATGVFGLRHVLLRAFPDPLKNGMTIALGLMIAVIGMNNCGLVKINEGFISMGDVTKGSPFLAMIGLLLTGILFALRIPAAVLLGIIATTLLGVLTGETNYKPVLESGALSLPPSISPIALVFDFNWTRIITLDFMIAVFTLLAIDIFDSLGTFVGVFNHFEGQEKSKYEKAVPRALMCDAVATVAGACVGTSTITTYVESSTGIAVGGRTGLTAVVIALLVAISLFASPLFLVIPAAATAPALIIVGMWMMAQASKIRFLEVTEGLPVLINILVTALTWSISDGLMYAWIGFVVLKLFAGKPRELNRTIILIGLFFLVRILFL